MKSRLNPSILSIFPAILLGVVAFVVVTGGRILRPRHANWLFENDPATFFLGWHFFRHAPMSLPLGANPDYGMDIGSSIVFTDSIPLVAFLFKPFDAVLPETFQYFGLWILLCFVLQAVFAYRLLARFTQDRWLPLLGSAFFVLAPAFLWRLHGHYALFAQWVLLAGLCLYFSPRFSTVRWIALLCITALIHAYLLVMVGCLWAADLVQRCLRREIRVVRLPLYGLAGAAITSGVMWFAGYFMIRGGLNVGGPVIFRMNLLSLIDPDDVWSRVLRDQPEAPGGYEGFNFLGIGMLAIGLVACFSLMQKPRIRIDLSRVAPLFLIGIGLSIYALSNHVMIGEREILVYDFPSFFAPIAGAFRSYGRMFWPVYYTLYLAIFYLLFSRFERRAVVIFCTVLLCVQVTDSLHALQFFRKRFIDPPEWSSPMRSPIWNEVAQQYRNIIFVLPHNAPESYLPLAYFASTHRMAINIGYFARVDPLKQEHARQRIVSQIQTGRLSPDSIYVFEDDSLWKIASNRIGNGDAIGIVDGFRIVAPRFKGCLSCGGSESTDSEYASKD